MWIKLHKPLIVSFAVLFPAWPIVVLAGGPPEANGWLSSVNLAYAWQGRGNLEDGGDFSVDRGVIEFEAMRRIDDEWSMGFSVGYGEDHYSFSQSTPVAGWGDIRTAQLGVSLRYKINEQWTTFGLPILRYSAEHDADLGDGREIGLLAGTSFRLSEKLTLGPGFGLFSGIGGEEDVFPILLVDWALSPTLSLKTGRGLAASRGPGLALKWQPSRSWEFGLAARYEKSRFHLEKEDRIGEDRAVPVILTAQWRMNPTVSFSVLAGFETSGKLSVENAAGDRLYNRSYDTAPLSGVVASMRF